MLTCKIGENTINCYDGTYSKDTLKKWADKNILLCHACGKPYEYCHGRIVQPYFRHKEKEQCEDKYSESETEEHIEGKKALYEWVKTLDGVYDAILEGWIPETHQRPDIMFKHDGKQYVIEYQCTPIASEYLERHDLYSAGGIIDLWILGTKNYLKSGRFDNSKRLIEKSCNAYFNSSMKTFILNFESIKNKLTIFQDSSFINMRDVNIDFKSELIDLKINYNDSHEYLDFKSKLRLIVKLLNKETKFIKYNYRIYFNKSHYYNSICINFRHVDLDDCSVNEIDIYTSHKFILTNNNSLSDFLCLDNNSIIKYIYSTVNSYYNKAINYDYPIGWEIEHMMRNQQKEV